VSDSAADLTAQLGEPRLSSKVKSGRAGTVTVSSLCVGAVILWVKSLEKKNVLPASADEISAYIAGPATLALESLFLTAWIFALSIVKWYANRKFNDVILRHYQSVIDDEHCDEALRSSMKQQYGEVRKAIIKVETEEIGRFRKLVIGGIDKLGASAQNQRGRAPSSSPQGNTTHPANSQHDKSLAIQSTNTGDQNDQTELPQGGHEPEPTPTAGTQEVVTPTNGNEDPLL